jgi:hypothetical protein
VRIPRGKHKGARIEDVYTNYLRYIAQEWDDPELVAEVENQLAQRAGRGVVRQGDGRTQVLDDE